MQFKFAIFAAFFIRSPCLFLKQKELIYLIRSPIEIPFLLISFLLFLYTILFLSFLQL